MIWAKRSDSLKLALASFWLLFTVCFALWWFKFSFDHISTLSQTQPENAAHWARQKNMVLWEGAAWVVLLVLGGVALIASVLKEKKRVRRIREFFASFSHEIKTSLASLRLQAEALQNEGTQSPILSRLIGDTVRLQLQLENSLFFSSQDHLKLYIEDLALAQILERMREQWPGLKIEWTGKCVLRGDERALRTVFSNLFQNSILHGEATVISVEAQVLSSGRVGIQISDNGKGFQGALTQLGQVFHRPERTSGSGLGLYICRILVQTMGGQFEVQPSPVGFKTRLELPGGVG